MIIFNPSFIQKTIESTLLPTFSSGFQTAARCSSYRKFSPSVASRLTSVQSHMHKALAPSSHKFSMGSSPNKTTLSNPSLPFPVGISRFFHMQKTSSNVSNRVEEEDGVLDLSNRSLFDRFAVPSDIPGTGATGTIKFLITDVDTDSPTIYFINTRKYPYHFDFVEKALKLKIENAEFNQQTYFTDNRKFLAGTILAYDNFTSSKGKKGAYIFEFWPTDPVKVQFVHSAFKQISRHMKIAEDSVYYHPVGETHSELFVEEREQYTQLKISVLQSEELFQNMSYIPMNLGQGYGYLRVANATDSMSYTVRDVVIFKSIPNELSHVAGILTEAPQTPLSHINLKARQNKTPNAYLDKASSQPEISNLIGKPVFYEVGVEKITLRQATDQEIEIYLDTIRPKEPTYPRRDLSKEKITSLDDVRHHDLTVFGAKAANVGELRVILSQDALVPKGFAIPFYFYDTFMKENRLYDQARAMIQDPAFKKSPEKREKDLGDFQKKIKKAVVPSPLQTALLQMQQAFPKGTSIRCRSSTNNEDLVGFNGAGLYDSYTYHPDDKDIGKTVKKVFSSLWNFRAFEEREFYRIDHFGTAMGVLVHQNFKQEQANGVAVTKNPYDPEWDGSYINVQVGEGLVTNPSPNATPDEILLMKTAITPDGSKEKLETIFIRHSSLTEKGKQVLSPNQIELLFEKLSIIQAHFVKVYGKAKLAMDVEFKIDKEGRLVIKQARPWVE